VLWLAVLLVVIHGHKSLDVITLNLMTLFGFLAPEKYIAAGSWSIGSEIVFYLFTPLIIHLYNKKKIYGNLFTTGSVCIGLFYTAFFNTAFPLTDQWKLYINPLNNFFLYCVGIALFYNFQEVKLGRNISFFLIALAIFGFVFSPFHGDQIVLVAGLGRVLFSFYSVFLVLGFYTLKSAPTRSIENFLNELGTASYSIYLMHPFVYPNLQSKLGVSDKILLDVLSCIVTFALAMVIYRLLERPLIRLGKSITSEEFYLRMRNLLWFDY
jgi:exopolysaccharide production protein ExoZ